MKKSFLIAVAFLGLALSSVNAQSCCTVEKENCKPKVCCPMTTDCCDGDAAATTKVKAKKNKKTALATKVKQQKKKAIKKEVALIEN